MTRQCDKYLGTVYEKSAWTWYNMFNFFFEGGGDTERGNQKCLPLCNEDMYHHSDMHTFLKLNQINECLNKYKSKTDILL